MRYVQVARAGGRLTIGGVAWGIAQGECRRAASLVHSASSFHSSAVRYLETVAIASLYSLTIDAGAQLNM